jgi:hypothetical protein
MSPQTADDNDAGEFAALTSLDLLAAYLHARYGEKALRQAFAMVDDLYHEQLMEAADTLDAKGLGHVGDIMADIAASRPSEYDAGCPYSDPINRRYWQQNWLRKHQQTPAERLERMKRHAAGKRQRMH